MHYTECMLGFRLRGLGSPSTGYRATEPLLGHAEGGGLPSVGNSRRRQATGDLETSVQNTLTASLSRPTRAVAAVPDPDAGYTALPAWPVVALIAGLPLWYVLGLLPFIHLPFGIAMAALLLHRARALLVPGILPWFAFVTWTVVSSLMLDSPSRYIGFGLRLSQWVVLGILMVYVVNARQSITLRRAVAIILVVWATTIVGGFLGMHFGGVRITTPVSMLLPQNLLQNEYVQDLVRPSLAQVDKPWGATEAFVRPSAPYNYANSWGAAIAVVTPVVIAAVTLTRSYLAKAVLIAGLLLSAVPAIATQNRGMLLALGFAIGYATLRLAMRANRLALAGMALLGIFAALELKFGFFTSGIAARQGAANTTEGRARLYIETFQRTLESPIVGWGAPRPSSTLEISVGTQGHLWFIMFSFGFVGLALFLAFLWGVAVRTADVPGTGRLWLHASLVAAGVMIVYYGIDGTMHLVIGLVAAVLLRDKYLHPQPPILLGRTPGLTEDMRGPLVQPTSNTR